MCPATKKDSIKAANKRMLQAQKRGRVSMTTVLLATTDTRHQPVNWRCPDY
jgi:hypothetical protein